MPPSDAAALSGRPRRGESTVWNYWASDRLGLARTVSMSPTASKSPMTNEIAICPQAMLDPESSIVDVEASTLAGGRSKASTYGAEVAPEAAAVASSLEWKYATGSASLGALVEPGIGRCGRDGDSQCGDGDCTNE